MNLNHLSNRWSYPYRHISEGDRDQWVIDFGPDSDVSCDVVGSTVILVVDDQHHEFEIPGSADDTQVFIRNGVLTIDVEEGE